MKFVAHPEDIPIHIEEVGYIQDKAHDVNGFGGISYLCEKSYRTGQSVQIKLTEIDPDFCVVGRIFKCEKEEGVFRIFIEFPKKEDCYCVRMIEQLSHIEHYRRQAKKQGRRLSFNEAAIEWIQKFAASFPELNP
ncbi:energy transducer TonB [Marinomonas agarivorans]|nr:energy transducer TonB [Marinomonas agarivorans]